MDAEEDSCSVINPSARPSYMDNLNSGSDQAFDFDNRVLRKLVDEFAYCAEDAEKIRTYLRIRPPSSRSTKPNVMEEVFLIQDDHTLVVRPLQKKSLTKDNSPNEFTYTYSRIFGQGTQQTVVFQQCVRPVLTEFLNGGNGLIFSYGATNSGKTYTMQGNGRDFGIVPRTLQQLFNRLGESLYTDGDIKPQQFDSYVILDSDSQVKSAETKSRVLREAKIKPSDVNSFVESMIRSSTSSVCSSSVNQPAGVPVFGSFSATTDDSYASLPDKSTVYSIWVSFAEVYNERVYDLFDNVPKGRRRRRELKIFQDKQSHVYIKDLTECNVNTAEEAYQFFLAGKQNLQFAATNVNANSSRSHSFFNIRIVAIGKVGNHLYPKEVRRFSFCDLAGLERMSQTGNHGLRLKESGNINQSLLVLLRCIRALRDQHQKGVKAEIIPYRDSKLTRLFQSYLTSATQISMIVNINPDPDMIDASIQVIQNSAIASTIRTFRKIEAPSNNTSFFHKIRKSIRLAHAEEGGDEDDSDEDTQTPVVTTAKRVKPALAPGEKIVNVQTEKLLFERRLRRAEDKMRENIQGEFDKLLESQKKHYEQILKSEREYSEAQTQHRVDLNLGVINDYVNKCINIEESDSTEEDDEPTSPLVTVRRHTMATPTQRPLQSEFSVQYLNKVEQKYHAGLDQIRDLTAERRELVETIQTLSNLRAEKSSQIKTLTAENEQFQEQQGFLELQICDYQDQLTSKEAQISSLLENNPSIRDRGLMKEILLLEAQVGRKESQLAEARQELTDGQAMCLEYDALLRTANAQIEDLTQQVNNLHKRNVDVGEECTILKLSLDAAKTEVIKLKQELVIAKCRSPSVKPHTVLGSILHSPANSQTSQHPSDHPHRVTAKHTMNGGSSGGPFKPRNMSNTSFD